MKDVYFLTGGIINTFLFKMMDNSSAIKLIINALRIVYNNCAKLLKMKNILVIVKI